MDDNLRKQQYVLTQVKVLWENDKQPINASLINVRVGGENPSVVRRYLEDLESQGQIVIEQRNRGIWPKDWYVSLVENLPLTRSA